MDTDEEHTRKLTIGSYKDFTCLYQKYGPQLYAFVFSLVKSHTQTKDILQETFIKIWEKRNEIQVDFSFKSYIFTIARNQVLNEFRRQLHNPIFLDYISLCAEEIPQENVTEEHIEFDEFSRLIKQAKRKLSPRQSEIFELIKEQGYTVQEIANRLNIQEQVVRNQLSTAIQILRSELGRYSFWFTIFYFYL